MESQKLPDKDKKGWEYFWACLVFFGYEFLGTVLLILVINVSGGRSSAIGIGLFLILLLTGPITGAHHNPALSLGVFINRGWSSDRMIMFVVYFTAQFAGAFCGAELSVVLLEDSKMSHTFPELTVSTPKYWQALTIEALATMLFVTANLLIKDPRVNPHVVNGQHWLGLATIALALVAMIKISKDHTGGAINPAVSLSQCLLHALVTKTHKWQDSFWTVYVLGPFIGAIVAGLGSWAHGHFLVEYVEKAGQEEAPAAEDPEAGKQPANAEGDLKQD